MVFLFFCPEYLKVYGCIFQLNRTGQRADPVSVLVDQWPEFRVLLIKPEYREVTRTLRKLKRLVECFTMINERFNNPFVDLILEGRPFQRLDCVFKKR